MGKIPESIGWLERAIKGGFNGWDLINTDSDLDPIRSLIDEKWLVKS